MILDFTISLLIRDAKREMYLPRKLHDWGRGSAGWMWDYSGTPMYRDQRLVEWLEWLSKSHERYRTHPPWQLIDTINDVIMKRMHFDTYQQSPCNVRSPMPLKDHQAGLILKNTINWDRDMFRKKYLRQSRMWVWPPNMRMGVLGWTARMALKTYGPEKRRDIKKISLPMKPQ